MNKYKSLLLSSVVGFPLAMASSVAVAQDATSGSSVSEIVVTAQRRSERLEDVPISVVSANADTMNKRGVYSVTDLDRISVGTKIGKTGINTNPSIRGVTTGIAASGQENNVAYYVDGFYQPSMISMNVDLPNVQQVTILKGPQGTLYGRNATGGAILVDTLNPVIGSFEGNASASYRRFNDRRASAYASIPLGDEAALGLAAYARKSDGYIKDIAGFQTAPIDQNAIRAKLLWRPTSDLSITAGYGRTYVSDATGVSYNFFAHQAALIQRPGFPVTSERNKTSISYQPYTQARVDNYQLKGEWDLGWATLSSYTQDVEERDSLRFDNDGSPAYLTDTIQTYIASTVSQEVVLASKKAAKVEWIVGALYYDQDFSSQTLSLNNVTGLYAGSLGRLGTRAYAIYGEATWHATDALSLTGGLRYSRERRTHKLEQPIGTFIIPHEQTTWDALTPRVVVRYELAPRTNVYASFSQGFKSGTYNVPTATPAVNPEKITAYEVGFKTVRQRLRFDAAAFYYDYKNMQVSTLQQTATGARVALFTNAATSRIYGAEATLAYAATDQLNLNAAVGYTHGRYKNFQNATAAAILSTNTGLQVGGLNVGNLNQDWSGLRLIRSPDWTLNVGSDYTQPISFGSLLFSGNVSYQSAQAPNTDTLFQTINTSVVPARLSAPGGYRYKQKGYALLSLQVAWRSPDLRHRVTVFGDNVTNTDYLVQLNASTFGDYRIFGQPATWGVRYDVSF